MTKIKLCGLSRPEDIAVANELKPDYIGFVFAEKSKRYVTPERAAELRTNLAQGIAVVGVFVNEEPERIAELMNSGVIDIAQLHGNETEREIARIRELLKQETDLELKADFRPTANLEAMADLGSAINLEAVENVEASANSKQNVKPKLLHGRIIQAFQVKSESDIDRARRSTADYVLLDSGAGTGETFDWNRIREVGRDYFLAGGLHPGNVADAVRRFAPYAVDVSSGIETDGFKDAAKMRAFVDAVRSCIV